MVIEPQLVLLLSHYFNSLMFLVQQWHQGRQCLMFQISWGADPFNIKPLARVCLANLVWCLANFFEISTDYTWL